MKRVYLCIASWVKHVASMIGFLCSRVILWLKLFFFFFPKQLTFDYIMKTQMTLELVERQTLLKPVFHLIGCIVHLAVLLTSD